MSTEKLKIGIVHPHLSEAGGSEASALYAAEALERDYKISLITMGSPDLNRLNNYYGTHLNPNSAHVISFPIPFFAKRRFHALRSYRLAKYCQKNSSDFDVMISFYNTMDFGLKGIQFIADFSFNDDIRESNRKSRKDLFDNLRGSRIIHRIYLWIIRKLSHTSKNGWKKNLTISNSDWTAQTMKRVYGIETYKIYPPVINAFSDTSWEKREPGFVYLGRISPEKNIEFIIEVIKSLRNKGNDVHLHVLGDSDDFRYMSKIKKLCEDNRKWAFFYGKVAVKEKLVFLNSHRFGLSACWNEAFGISIAEMVRAGCIVWVPDGGGQTEIVEHPQLIFSGIEDAVEKIDGVLKDQQQQAALGKHLEDRSRMFSTEKYSKDVESVVVSFLKDRL